MSEDFRVAVEKGKRAATSYWLRRIRRASLALSIAFPILVGVEFYRLFRIGADIAMIHAVYWYSLVAALVASFVAYKLYKYIQTNAQVSTPKATLAFAAISILGFSGFIFIGALN